MASSTLRLWLCWAKRACPRNQSDGRDAVEAFVLCWTLANVYWPPRRHACTRKMVSGKHELSNTSALLTRFRLGIDSMTKSRSGHIPNVYKIQRHPASGSTVQTVATGSMQDSPCVTPARAPADQYQWSLTSILAKPSALTTNSASIVYLAWLAPGAPPSSSIRNANLLMRSWIITRRSMLSSTENVNYSGAHEKTDSKEIKPVNKLDLFIMPTLWSMYWLNYLDRNAIALARLDGLEKDHNLTSTQYQTCVSTLFVGYILAQFPSNMLLMRVRPSQYMAGCMALWAVVSSLTTIAKDFR